MLCLLYTHPTATFATEADCLHIASPVWPGETNADGSGLYFDLFRAVFTPLEIDLCIESVPFKRVIHMLRNKSIDASIGFYSAQINNTLGNDSSISSASPIGQKRVVAIYKATTFPNWNFPQSLKNRRVSCIYGYGFQQSLSVPVEYQRVSTSAQGWHLLQAGRIDAFLDSYTDAIDARTNLGNIDLDQYRIKTVATLNLYAPFAQTSRGQRYKALFDQRIQELRENGELALIYQSWGRELPPCQ